MPLSARGAWSDHANLSLLPYLSRAPRATQGRLAIRAISGYPPRALMAPARLTLLADERFAPLLPALEESLAAAAESITPENFMSLLDDTMRHVIQLAFRQAESDDGTIWLVDGAKEALVPGYNTGPDAERILKFRQPLSAGLVSMVFGNERPFLENEVPKNAKQDRTLDKQLGKQTLAMVIVPFYFLGACRGVISCVKMGVPGETPPETQRFAESAQVFLVHGATVLGRLLDLRLLRSTMGLR